MLTLFFFTFSFLFSFTIPLHISLYILIYTLHIIYHIHNFSLNLIQLTVFSCYATLALVILVRALADPFEPPTLDNQSKITHQLQCHSIAFVTQLIILYCILFCTLIMSNPNSPLHSPPGSPQPHQEQQQQPQQQDNNPPSWLPQIIEALKPPSSSSKLSSSLPNKYSASTSQHATGFINSMEVYFTLQESSNGKIITDREKILHTMLNTEGPALLWAQNYVSTYPDSDWSTFKS